MKYGYFFNWPEIPPFRKGPFLCSAITSKIFHLQPWNLVENSLIDLSLRYISQYLTNISYLVFRIFNVRGGYPYPQNPEFLVIFCSLNFMQEAWKATTKLHLHDFISYVCNAYLTFWSIFYKMSRFYEEIGLKWHTFCKETLQGWSIARQICHLDSWNLVQNCPTASYCRTISHYLTILSYIVSRTLNVRKGYPYPPNPEFLAVCCSLNFM